MWVRLADSLCGCLENETPSSQEKETIIKHTHTVAINAELIGISRILILHNDDPSVIAHYN